MRGISRSVGCAEVLRIHADHQPLKLLVSLKSSAGGEGREALTVQQFNN